MNDHRVGQEESEAPAKRSQHANTTYRNIVGRNMLCAFGHHVAMCCDELGVVGSSLKMVKLEPTTANMSQHFATLRNTVAKRTQHVAPNNVAICCIAMLRSFSRGLRKRKIIKHTFGRTHYEFILLIGAGLLEAKV